MRSNRKQRREGIAKPVEPAPEVQPEAGRMDAEPQKLVPQSNAGECTSCVGLRLKNRIPNRTFIYAKRGVVRYCKCHVCGHTWKVAPRERL